MNPLDWSLTSGPLPVLVLVAGAVSVLWLIFGQWRRALVMVVVAALLSWGIAKLVDDVWKPFPDPLPSEVVRWIAVALFGILLAVSKLFTPGRLLSVVSGLLVVVMASSQINRSFDNYPTVRSLVDDVLGGNEAKFTGDKGNVPTVSGKDGQKLVDVWKPPANMPSKGTVYAANIPGTLSKFKARTANIYVPPAYLASPRALLPVLVLLAGQPGAPSSWINSGGLPAMMDDFASRHSGLAPVVVMADNLGDSTANPLCVDSKLGNIETYLTKDVPNWVDKNLKTQPSSKGWTIAGLSAGGTCSLQMAVRAPKLYPRFIDISGQEEPTVGNHKDTVQKAFNGDEAAFKKINPLDIMATAKFPDSAGVFIGGSDDPKYTTQLRKVYEAAQKAGMDVTWKEFPGGHSWQVWRAGLSQDLDWLGQRTGLI